MLFLAVCKINQPAPPQSFQAYIDQCDYCERLEKQGKVKVFAPYADFSGGIAILDVASNEEAQQVLAQGPIFPFVSAELVPLVATGPAKQLVRQMMEMMSKR